MKKWLRTISMLLTVVLLLNMLPLQILAENFQEEQASMIEEATGKSTEVYALEEVEEKRTEFSKSYRMNNGQFMAMVYPTAVHYESNGSWEEIDNTLKAEGTVATGNYVNTAGVWDVSFPRTLNENRYISIEKDGYTLSFGMAGEMRSGTGLGTISATATVTKMQQTEAKIEQTATRSVTTQDQTVHLEKNTSRLTYENVYANTDVRYDLQGNMVKESVILESYDSKLEGYRYILKTGTLQPELKEDGSIEFYDAEGKNIVMYMPAPYLLDAENAYCADVEVSLIGKGGIYNLSYQLPKDWLSDADRSWPVVLDPVVFANTNINNIGDCTVGSLVDEGNGDGSLEVGYDTSKGIQRSYVKFNNLPELTSADVIIEATISLLKPYDSDNESAVEVHKVREAWASESLTWSNKPEYSEIIEDYARVSSAQQYTWNITDIVREWYADENTGMMFKLNDAAENNNSAEWQQFWSSDYSDVDLTTKPTLVIQYRNNNGLEGYWDYTSSSAGRAGAGYVNNYTGNLIWIRNDLGFSGNRMPVSINHIYNTNDSANNEFGMGYGWRTNYNQRVYPYTDNEYLSYYVWEDGDGTKHYFLQDKDAENTYKDEDGLELMLTTGKNSDDKTEYTITDKYGNKSVFDNEKRLYQIENKQLSPSSITISYESNTSSLISTIRDGAGRVYDFNYTNENLLSQICYKGKVGTDLSNLESLPTLATVSFSYTGSQLTGVTDNDGKTSQYTYTGNNLLQIATDIDGYKLTYTYNTTIAGKPSRVANIAESHNNVAGIDLDFEYAHNQTTITDANGNVQIMQFNNLGNTVSIQDNEGRAQFAQFAINSAEESGKGNQLKAASKLQNTVGNILKNSSFEGEASWVRYSGSEDNYGITADNAYHGTKSLYGSINGDLTLRSEEFTIEANTTYTFSGYVKTHGASAAIGICPTSGTGAVYSEELPYWSGWKRLEVSYTNNTSSNITAYAVFDITGGAAYLDCAQVEKSPNASRYNLIENGDFRNGTANWSGSGTTNSDYVTTLSAASRELDNQVYKMTGNPGTNKYISQQVSVSGSEGDTFVLAGWAKGDAAPLTTDDRTFGLFAVFHYTDGTTSEKTEPAENKNFRVSFNPDADSDVNWQYVSRPVVAEKAYNAVTVRVEYGKNVNTAHFDGIQLFKEEFGSSYTYDANGNVVATQTLDGDTQYEYTNNNLTKEIMPTGGELTYEYDNYHNVTKATTENGVVYTFAYDTYGNNTSVSTTVDGVTYTASATYSYDGNHLATSTDTLGNTTTYQYSPDTSVLLWYQSDEDNVTEDETGTESWPEYTYDSMFRVATASVKTYYETVLNATYTYTNDQLTRLQTLSTAYDFTYGNFGLRSSIKIGDRALANYTYSGANHDLTRLDYGNGDSVSYTYDNQGRLTNETYEDNRQISYAYDNSGNLGSVTDSAIGTTKYSYDLTDRLSRMEQRSGSTIRSIDYRYDSLGRMSGWSYNIPGLAADTISYFYDSDKENTIPEGTLTSMTTNNGATMGYTYDRLQRLTDKYVTDEIWDRYAYNGGSSQVAAKTVWIENDLVKDYRYFYDGNGNIVTERDILSGYTQNYTYDVSKQLTGVSVNYGDTTRTESYTYDDAGNLLTFNNGVRSHTLTYGDSAWGDLLTAVDGETITYDGLGNPTSYYDGYRYTLEWEHGRQLKSMTYNGNTVSYEYDANGIRTKKINPTGMSTDYYVVDGKAIGEVVKYADGTIAYWLRYLFDESDQIIGYSFWCVGDTAWSEYYFAKNLQGDVVGVYRASDNAQVAFYEYDAWGNILYKYGDMADINPFRYRTYYYDNETWFYYLQSRYYDPAIGRFINADAFASTGQGLLGNNMFVYCNNNPVMFEDASGYAFRTCTIIANDGGYAVKTPPTTTSSSNPAPIDITTKLDDAMQENAATLSEYRSNHNYLNTVTYFIDKVKPNGEWDFKSQESWALDPNATYVYNGTELRYDAIGNIHYGYVGRVIFSTNMLLYAGGIVQISAGTSDWSYWNSNFDDPQDQWAIQIGCELWDKEAVS